MDKLRLSPASLNLYLDCARCFWLDKNKKFKRPAGIFPSLPGGMDIVIKEYFDKHRKLETLPEEVENIVGRKLFKNQSKMRVWRSWRATDLRYETDEAYLSGALDDCIVHENNETYHPLDYKTRGAPPKGDGVPSYYKSQMDLYCLMFEASGYETNELAYLLYYWPKEVTGKGIVVFNTQVVSVKTNIEAGKALVKSATDCLKRKEPDASISCDYCRFREG